MIKLYGKSINSYLIGKMMDYAKELLKNGAKITKVAKNLNCLSLHNFSRAFKARFGIAPSRTQNRA